MVSLTTTSSNTRHLEMRVAGFTDETLQTEVPCDGRCWYGVADAALCDMQRSEVLSCTNSGWRSRGFSMERKTNTYFHSWHLLQRKWNKHNLLVLILLLGQFDWIISNSELKTRFENYCIILLLTSYQYRKGWTAACTMCMPTYSLKHAASEGPLFGEEQWLVSFWSL